MVSLRCIETDSAVSRRAKSILISQPLLVALVGNVVACSSSGAGVEGGTAGGTTATGGATAIAATGGSPFVVSSGGSVSTGGATYAAYTTQPAAVCGDGVVEAGEACDDGNTSSGDGCSADCSAIEPNYVCPQPGQLCVLTMVCGDKKITGTETCDDGNTVAGDGCSDSCQVETGWDCPIVGAACRAAQCGDGIIAGSEVCDDGNAVSGDGCSSTCQVEPGYVCDTAGQVCRKTVCGDGVLEGTEECDDGNVIPYDGCSPTCTIEPQCANGTCTAVCGDGLKFPQEACDDGNTRSGDGCSADCQVESGYTCKDTTQTPPTSLVIPILYRDFLYDKTPAESGHPAGHPDFETSDPTRGPCSGAATGLVATQLGADGKPAFASSQGSGCNVLITSASTFASWYHDDPLNIVVPSSLTLTQSGTNTYSFSSSSFFPLNGLGWQDAKYCSGASPTSADCQINVPTPTNPNGTPPWCSQWATTQLASQCSSYGPPPTQSVESNNFSFTSELRYPFTYQGGEVFTFTGDDDVWAFVNGTLAVDLGGIHQQVSNSVTLSAANAQTYGLTVGGMYEIALFQAERHVIQSNYKVTLAGFDHTISVCKSVCGDGIVTPDEACDLGAANNTGAYGGCNPDCTLAPYCGDDIVQTADGEQCDDGVNLATYGYNGNSKACGPNCQFAPYCGDGNVNSLFGEQCDDAGQQLNDGCESNCMIGPLCGNGKLDPGEECDDGNTVSGDGCSQFCKIEHHIIT